MLGALVSRNLFTNCLTVQSASPVYQLYRTLKHQVHSELVAVVVM